MIVLLCLGTFLMGCMAPVAQAELGEVVEVLPASEDVTPTPSPTRISEDTPSHTPTPVPTVALLMFTPTVTPTLGLASTPQPTPVPAIWEFPAPVVPDAFGLEIHFTRPSAQVVDNLASSGVRWVRKDLFWNEVEWQPGLYDFGAYDALVAALRARDIRIIFILDYGNPFYDGGNSPHTAEGRAAFARFAATAARRYRGQGIVWEIWNEPNLQQFWHPTPNATNYARLVLTTVDAIRRVDPTALIMGPALVSFEWPYWDTLGQMGVFNRLDAVSLHPYGFDYPEQALQHYPALRALIDRYSPDWTLPLVVSEAGYSSLIGGYSADIQAQFLTRLWLSNLAYDVPLTIWYDWRNNGIDPAELQQNFGIVTYDYAPKPAYYAVRTLAQTLDGYRFMRRIAVGSVDDYVLLFQKANELALVSWTVTETHDIVLPLPLDEVPVVSLMGEPAQLTRAPEGFRMTLTGAPSYMMLGGDPTILRLGSWRPHTTFQRISAGEGASVRLVIENPFQQPRHAEVEVRVAGETRGSLIVFVPPETGAHFRIPIDIQGLSGAIPAEVQFITPDEALVPLQSARIWLTVAE